MNVLILNGSPAGKDSITLQTAALIMERFPAHTYETLHVGRQIKRIERDFSECGAALARAELIVFCYPVYTFLVPAQLHRLIELIKERGVDLHGKCATQISTSKHFYDTTAHKFIEENCADLGLRYIRGLSADMEDLLTERGREQALAFFSYVEWSVASGSFEEPAALPAPEEASLSSAVPAAPTAKRRPGGAVIVADLSGDDSGRLRSMIGRFRDRFCYETRVVDLAEFPFAGGCLGCFRCAADGKCVYRDGFDTFLREQIQSADATVYAFTVRDHSMGYRFKLYDDRQFCNGHRTVTMGKPVGYLIDGDLRAEPNLGTLIAARAQVGGNFLAGAACTAGAPDEAVDRLARTLAYALEHGYRPPADFYGVGGMKIFRDLIYRMQGLMRADHRFYKSHGFYKDYPQRHPAQIAAMYLVGSLMANKNLAKKMGSKMTEGMLMPYTAALEKARRENTQPHE